MPEAEAVLRLVLPVDPDSPYLLARLVEVLARDQNKKEETLRAVLQIFFRSTEESTWPTEFAWEAVKKAHFQEPIYQKARESIEAGQLPTPTALSFLASHALVSRGTEKRALQPAWRAWFPDRGAQEARALLKIVDAAQKASGAHRACLLRELSNLGYQRAVVNYWKKHRAVVEGHVETWGETARALVGVKRTSAVRRLVGSWRGRGGVPMWVVANYLLSITGLRSKNLREVLATSRDALAGLPHDHCAKYLAHRQAEAAVLLGDRPAFRKIWKTYRNYFDARAEAPEWFEARRRHLLLDIPIIGRALEGNDVRMYRRMRRSLRWKEIAFALGRPKTTNARANARWGALVVWLLWMLWMLAQLAGPQ